MTQQIVPVVFFKRSENIKHHHYTTAEGAEYGGTFYGCANLSKLGDEECGKDRRGLKFYSPFRPSPTLGSL